MNFTNGRSKDTFSSIFLKKSKACVEIGVRASGPLFVILASGLITLVVVLHFRFIIPYFGKPLSSTFGIINTIISVFIAGNLLFNYFMIVFTPPGYSTEDNSVPQPEEEINVDFAPKKGEGFSRFCKACKRSKPERSHHCHICKRCVLKMDHHCPWVSNCVGLNNHRYFVLFLVYLWAGCFYVAIMTWFPFKNSSMSDQQAWNGHNTGVIKGITLFVFVITITITLALSFMLSWQMYLVLTGQTTIEFYYNRFKLGQARARGERWINVYNHGVMKNFHLFFESTGRPFIFAFLPSTRMPIGTGAEKRSEEGYYV